MIDLSFDRFTGTAMHALSLRGLLFLDGVECSFVSALVMLQGVFGDSGNRSRMLRNSGHLVSDVQCSK
jgi:hypothetical protein